MKKTLKKIFNFLSIKKNSSDLPIYKPNKVLYKKNKDGTKVKIIFKKDEWKEEKYKQ